MGPYSIRSHHFFLKVVVSLASLFLMPAGFAYQTAPKDSYVILGGTLIDGTGKAAVQNSALLVSQGRVVAAGSQKHIRIPPGTRVIDAKGKWIVPGLIDAHVHFDQSAGLFTRPDIIDLRNQRSYEEETTWLKQRIPYTMSRYICSGVTSVVDVGGPLWTLSLKQKFFGKKYTPNLSVAGPLLSTYIPQELNIADPPIIALGTPQMAQKSVKNIIQRGANLIKIWFLNNDASGLTMDSIKAVIHEAHTQGVRVIVHATKLSLARLAVAAGADILAHSVFDTLIDANFLQLLKQKNIIYIPTLLVGKNYNKVLQGQPELSPIEKVCGDPQVIATWKELPEAQQTPFPEDPAIAQENLRRVAKAGVRIAAGSDAGNIGTLHGPALHKELELMVQAGLSPEQALISATRNAAYVMHPHPEVGTLEAGKLADILILNGDPLRDIRTVSKIQMVIKGGKIMRPEEFTGNETKSLIPQSFGLSKQANNSIDKREQPKF